MQEQEIKQTLQSSAEQAVPPEVDVWPALRLRAQQLSDARRKRATRTRLARHVLAGITVALALVSGLVLAVPSARAAVGGALQQFGLIFVDFGEVNVLHTEVLPGATVNAPAGVEVLSVITSTTPASITLSTLKKWGLEEARAIAPFPIHTPAWLPTGFTFDGVMFSGLYTGTNADVPSQVTEASLYYTRTEQTAGLATQNLTLHISKPAESGQLLLGYMASREHTRQVQVNGQPALYVPGGYEYDETTQTMRWDENKHAGALAWQMDGVNYIVSYNDLDISLETLTRIAESVR
jgi:hypothetical protein